MKTIYIFIITCFVFLTARSQEQDSIPVTSVFKVGLNEKMSLDDILEVEFVKLVSDSRCPKNVQCVWAGEAVVLVKLHRNGTFEQETQITINPRGLETSVLELFSSDKTHTTAIKLMPYPDATLQEMKPYYLEFCVEN